MPRGCPGRVGHFEEEECFTMCPTKKSLIRPYAMLVLICALAPLAFTSCGSDPCEGEEAGTVVCEECDAGECVVRCRTC